MRSAELTTISMLFLPLVLWAAAGLGCAASQPPVASAGFQAQLTTRLPSPEGERAAAYRLAPLPVPHRVDLAYRDIIHPERRLAGSLSTGNASSGHLSGAVSLPLDGDHIFVLPSNIPREAYYATEELRSLMIAVADDLAQAYPGSRLPLGDGSARHGGDIPHHGSHNSGRDIDIPFLEQRLDGSRTETDDFRIFDEQGRAGRRLFDVERNWLVVRSVIERSQGRVQWIFVARTLRRLLLEHARAIGEDPEIIARASDLLWQPSQAGAHDDHFHVRIFCSPRDRIEGCIDTPPYWSWIAIHPEVLAARVDELLRGLGDEDVAVRRQAIDFLVDIDARQAAERLAGALPDQPADVQIAILDALAAFRQPGLGRQVVALVRSSDQGAVRRAALRTAAAYPMPEAADLLVQLILDEELPSLPGGVPVSREAARALLDVQDSAIVGHLIDGLAAEDGPTRALVARVLSRTTGFSVGVDWERASQERRERAIGEWIAWYAEHRTLPRDRWVAAAFARQGIELPEGAEWGRRSLSQLIDEVDSPEPIGYLAQQQLVRVTGRRPPPARYSSRRQKGYWRNIVDRMAD